MYRQLADKELVNSLICIHAGLASWTRFEDDRYRLLALRAANSDTFGTLTAAKTWRDEEYAVGRDSGNEMGPDKIMERTGSAPTPE